MSEQPLDASRLRVFIDFDGTITRVDTLQFLTERLGGGAELYRATGRALRDGTMSLREGVARDIGSLAATFDEAARLLTSEVELDPGFVALARWCTAERVPLTVLSAGFHEIIDLFVTPGAFPDLDVRANRFVPGTWRCEFRDDSPLGHDKARAVCDAQARGGYAVFIGDGFSDREPAAVADEVFARAGRSLVAYCRAQGIECREFETLADVLGNLAARLAPSRHPAAGP
jgi:HAD superfamily phosphoserine phosphatase-like hydrolase